MQYTRRTSEVCEVNTLHTFLNTEEKKEETYLFFCSSKNTL